MRETGRVAIARVVIRSKEALVALRPMDDHVLGMSTMLFPDEIVDPDGIDEISDTTDVEVTKRELDIAKQLVESLAGDVRLRPSTTTPIARTCSTSSSARRPARRSPCSRRPTRRRSRCPTSWPRSRRASTRCATRTPSGNGASKAKKAPAKPKAKSSSSGSRKKAASKS